MLTVDEALLAILSPLRALPAERVSLLAATGRVLAEDVLADIDNPPFDNSAVDGYAVRADDTRDADPGRPVILRELAEVPAGIVADLALEPGACMRVMTGAPIPGGADAMVMVEDTLRSDSTVQILSPARLGAHIRRAGEDVRRGTRVLEQGMLVGPAEIAMLAALGCSEPLCVARPRVAVLSTGDELVDPAVRPGPGQVRDTNRFTMAALVGEAGAELHAMKHVPDDQRATEAALRSFAGLDGGAPADVIVTSGGVSVGDRDYVKPAIEKLGTLDFWRVKMKPGKPIAVGRIGGTLFFGLPGNPVSTMVTFELFVRPVLWKLAGRTDVVRPRVPAVLDADIDHGHGREEFVRATVSVQQGRFHARATGAQGSGMLTSMLGANALIVIPADLGPLHAGSMVDAMLLAPLTAAPAIRSGSS